MAIKTIPLSRLEADLAKTLNECAETGEIPQRSFRETTYEGV